MNCVDLPICELPHELLVLLQALRGELSHDQVPVVVVLGRVHRGELIAERQFVTVLLDQLAHIVAALELNRKAGERTGYRVARRERVGIGVDGAGLFISGDHVDAWFGCGDRALSPQPIEVRVRVGDQLVASEEIDGVVVDIGSLMVLLSVMSSSTNVTARRWNRHVPSRWWRVSWYRPTNKITQPESPIRMKITSLTAVASWSSPGNERIDDQVALRPLRRPSE